MNGADEGARAPSVPDKPVTRLYDQQECPSHTGEGARSTLSSFAPLARRGGFAHNEKHTGEVIGVRQFRSWNYQFAFQWIGQRDFCTCVFQDRDEVAGSARENDSCDRLTWGSPPAFIPRSLCSLC